MGGNCCCSFFCLFKRVFELDEIECGWVNNNEENVCVGNVRVHAASRRLDNLRNNIGHDNAWFESRAKYSNNFED